MRRPRASLGLEVLNSPQEPQVKLTVGNELINFLIDLTLKIFTRTAWHQSCSRTCFKPTDGAHENPRKGNRTLPRPHPIPPPPCQVYEKVRPEVCASGTPGKAKNTWPIRIPLQRDDGTPDLKQYPLRQEHHFSHRLTCRNTSQCIQKRTKRETNCEDLLGSHFGHCAVAHS